MICMLAHINNYSKECIEIACHRIIYLLFTEECLPIVVLDGATLHPYFYIQEWQDDISTTCEKAACNCTLKTELLKNQPLLLKVFALIIHKVKKICSQKSFDKKIPSQICLCLGFCTADTQSIKHPYREYHCSKGLSSLLITQVELAYSSLNHVKTFSFFSFFSTISVPLEAFTSG